MGLGMVRMRWEYRETNVKIKANAAKNNHWNSGALNPNTNNFKCTYTDTPIYTTDRMLHHRHID